MLQNLKTNVKIEELTKVASNLTTLPENINFLRKIERLIGERKKCFLKKES